MQFTDLPDWALLALIIGAAALLIALKAALSPARKGQKRANRQRATRQTARSAAPAPAITAKTHVLIDGSNVIHWRVNAGLDTAPSLRPLTEVLAMIAKEGKRAGVIFDATAGYHLLGRYLDDADLKTVLPEAADVFVVPKGTKADDFLIDMAKRKGLRIISNDRFRDHPDHHRITKQRGEIVNGQIQLTEPRK